MCSMCGKGCQKCENKNCEICKIEINEKTSRHINGTIINGFCKNCSEKIFERIFDVNTCDGISALCNYWVENDFIDRNDLIKKLKYCVEDLNFYFENEEYFNKLND